jgi:hypothetical protein
MEEVGDSGEKEGAERKQRRREEERKKEKGRKIRIKIKNLKWRREKVEERIKQIVFGQSGRGG